MEQRIADLVSAAIERPSPFYRARLQAIGVADAAQLDAESWQRLPPTRRDELVADQVAHLPHGSRRLAEAAPPVRAGATGSGTDLLVLTWTKADLACERAAGVRTLRALGVEPGMRVANALPGALATPGSLLFGDVVDELGALDVPLGTVRDEVSAKAAWKLIDRVEANVIVVDAAASQALFASAPAGPRSGWVGVINLRNDDAAPDPQPQVPAALGFGGWQRFWLAVPEAASFVGVSCAAGSLHADAGVLVEIYSVGEAKLPPRGESGHVVLTPLARDQVLLRYLSTVRAREIDCACGNPGTALRLE